MKSATPAPPDPSRMFLIIDMVAFIFSLTQTTAGIVIAVAAGAALLAALCRFVVFPLYWLRKYKPQEGDILFQMMMPRVSLVKAIEGCSESCYSHCGVVIRRNGRWRISEAMIFGVRETSLFLTVARGRRGKFAIFRLTDDMQHHVPQFVQALDKYQGMPYDYEYRLDDDHIYCSELVFRSFRDATGLHLGELKTLGELNWGPYLKTLQAHARGELPFDRVMITPRHLSESHYLEKVFSNGI